MTHQDSISALRLLQTADAFRANLAGEFSAVHGISVNEFILLLHLDRAEANRLSRVELGKRMHVSASTITRMTAPMEKTGFVRRETDPRDARMSFVVITDTGRERLGHVRATFDKRAQYLFQDRCTQDEVAQLSSVLNRIAPETLGTLT